MNEANLVDRKGIEPNRQPPNILRQRIYSPPLGIRSKICNTLRYAFRPRQKRNEECVLKQTTHRPRPFDCSAICFNTNGFYTSALSPQTYHPRCRPH